MQPHLEKIASDSTTEKACTLIQEKNYEFQTVQTGLLPQLCGNESS